MKTLAYIPLHYGKEYLEVTIKSIDPHVDKILILYTNTPSYGQDGRLKNPDTREELKNIAFDSSSKIEWVEIPKTRQENKHRELAFNYAKGYDLIMAVDADEVWDDVEEAKKLIDQNKFSKVKKIIVGGKERQDSVYNGLQCIDPFFTG